ncbi:hypothetical protein N7493_009786 [Penicillium malachiteum]|uniref:Uncharacterized protein n=1 Tax=Penicillium malachiteum TaxID=1324776 RepID=A0AAD6HES2_9EURO|nr:hypothetical protein N7493_009786 [Penicillium malachiteum]
MRSTGIADQVGWVDEPNARGTWDILSTCILTIALCCWSSVYPNIPRRSDNIFRQSAGKINLFFIGLLGPEFLLVIALGQWSSARASFKKFRDAGYENWTMTHAFFADMGGFLLECPGSKTFPIDAEQLFWLVKDGYMDYPDLDTADIKDKSKSDSLARMITIGQAAWFFINCIIRVAQNLFLTTLELTTLSFILIFFVTSFCWQHKPKDISRAMILKTPTPIALIRSKYHPRPEEPWYQTPLDFLSREEWVIARLWRYYVQILHYLHIPIFTRPSSKPYDYLPSDTFLRPDRVSKVLFVPCELLFACIFLFAWNFTFPTPTEMLVWRIAAVYQAFFGVTGGLSIWYAEEAILPKHLEKFELFQCPPKKTFPRFAWKLRNIHPDGDPDLTIPLRILFPNILLSVLYSLSRAFILVEDFIGLRSLPGSAFEVVSWSKYIPHW